MTDRIPSGHAALDDVLGGGLPANAISLIMGLPGSGKTIIAQHYAFWNARPERPAVYFSTVSEPLDKIVRFGQSMGYFDERAIGRSVFFEDLGVAVNQGGLAGVVTQIADTLKARRPGMLIIDSFKALQAFADTFGDFRRFLYELAGTLSAFPTTSLWVGEYEDSEVGVLAEFAVADAIIELSTLGMGQRDVRFLEVRKLRGSGFRSGRHAYRLDGEGLHLFPRLADTTPKEQYTLGAARISSGIAALDELVAEGYWPGATTLIAGPSGSGKTLMGLHFIFDGARQGEPGVIATLQENTTQLQRVVGGFGWSLHEPHVEVLYRSPVDIYIDEWVYQLLGTVERMGARRVLIDSLLDLRIAAPDETRFQEFLYSLVQRFSCQGVSLLMTLEIAELFGANRLAESAYSHLSDNVVLLNYLKDRDTLRREVSIIKTRGSRHELSIREYTIGPEGIRLAARPPAAASGMGLEDPAEGD